MTQANGVLDFLWSIAPEGATNSQIGREVGISSHQTVYMLTQQLIRRGLILGLQAGRNWIFFAIDRPEVLTQPAARKVSTRSRDIEKTPLTPYSFEVLARTVLSQHFGVALAPGSVPGVRKKFDFLSDDRVIVGDAKYFTRVGGTGLPPAKFSIIAEHVWLLEKTGAQTRFLAFGNDRAVPTLWLERYGDLASSVQFYFLTDEGVLDLIRPAVST